MRFGFEHGLDAGVGNTSSGAQGGCEMGLQGGHGHTTILAGVDAVTGVCPSHGAIGCRQTQLRGSASQAAASDKATSR